eukprot:CAMPEP_0117420788 /NCGR_PEP_ID=MMETSP0758-20121206/2052_1 /TAXON_ID=63605 /ORGANISM="Percolomonas cosmopolitus, Strain AE-1 (ATCC 50343)" /LENGTH=391 /DNA_ID=CAMNT_0005202607 /DNA_START=1416 /DNA_END=2591 /DNA_ORIENTATION=+
MAFMIYDRMSDANAPTLEYLDKYMKYNYARHRQECDTLMLDVMKRGAYSKVQQYIEFCERIRRSNIYHYSFGHSFFTLYNDGNLYDYALERIQDYHYHEDIEEETLRYNEDLDTITTLCAEKQDLIDAYLPRRVKNKETATTLIISRLPLIIYNVAALLQSTKEQSNQNQIKKSIENDIKKLKKKLMKKKKKNIESLLADERNKKAYLIPDLAIDQESIREDLTKTIKVIQKQIELMPEDQQSIYRIIVALYEKVGLIALTPSLEITELWVNEALLQPLQSIFNNQTENLKDIGYQLKIIRIMYMACKLLKQMKKHAVLKPLITYFATCLKNINVVSSQPSIQWSDNHLDTFLKNQTDYEKVQRDYLQTTIMVNHLKKLIQSYQFDMPRFV